MQSTWLLAFPALLILVLSLGAIFLPFGPPRKRWPFVFIALINLATLITVLVPLFPHGPADLPVPDVAGNGEDTVEAGDFWISGDGVAKHTCPSESCAVVGHLAFRDSVQIYGFDGGWARVSDAKKALCVNGRIRFADSGNEACDPSNGITDGAYYEWISADRVSEDLPSSGSDETDVYEAMISGSDDFRKFRDAFAAAARESVRSGLCTSAELVEQGGFKRATGIGNREIYFAFCGGDTMSDRVFVEPRERRVFR